jgi:hypothetical protein
MISWRLPKDESLSDWTLKAKNRDTDDVDEYNVHKTKLCVGPWMCEFFTSMMRVAHSAPGFENNPRPPPIPHLQ